MLYYLSVQLKCLVWEGNLARAAITWLETFSFMFLCSQHSDLFISS